MLHYAIQACSDAGIDSLYVVVGYQHERVRQAFDDDPRITWVVQTIQLGPAHAVMMCEPLLRDFEGTLVVIAGDMPLIRSEVLRQLIDTHHREQAAMTLGTAELNDPTGYGRILRDDKGVMIGIVEHQDCDPEQRRIREVNISYYCFDSRQLWPVLQRIEPSPAKGEYYLTDAVQLLMAQGHQTATLSGLLEEDSLGVNSPQELARVEEVMRLCHQP